VHRAEGLLLGAAAIDCRQPFPLVALDGLLVLALEDVDEPWMAASFRQHLRDPVFLAQALRAADVLDLDAVLVGDPLGVLAEGLENSAKSKMRSLLP